MSFILGVIVGAIVGLAIGYLGAIAHIFGDS